jgi:hypothetical protein
MRENTAPTRTALDRAGRCVKCGAMIDAGRIVSETAQWFVARGTHVECALAPTWAFRSDPFEIAPDAMPQHAQRQAQLRRAFHVRALFGAARLDAEGLSIGSQELERAVRADEIEQLTDHLGRPLVALSVDFDWRDRRVARQRDVVHKRANRWIRTAKYCFQISLGWGPPPTYPALARGAIFAIHASQRISVGRAQSLEMMQRGSMPTPLVWIIGARASREERAMDARRWLDFVGYAGDLAHVFHSRALRTRREFAAVIDAFERSQRPELVRAVTDIRDALSVGQRTVARLESFAAVGDWGAVRSMLRLQLSLRPPPRRRGDGDPLIADAIVRWLGVRPVRSAVLDYLATIDDAARPQSLAHRIERDEGKAASPQRVTSRS